MLEKLFHEQQRQIARYFSRLDLEKAEAICAALSEVSGSVIFTGVGKSGHIAEKLATTMISVGIKSIYLNPSNALHGDIGIVSSDDLVVCISKSGETEELTKLLPFLKERGAKTMAWVCHAESSLCTSCDQAITLPIDKELCPFDLAPTTSTAIQLLFGDLMAVALMQNKQFSLEAYFQNHPSGTIGKKVATKVSDLMLKRDELPLLIKTADFREAIMVLTETRKGCVLIVDENDQLVGIFTDGDVKRVLRDNATEDVLSLPIERLITKHYLSVESGKAALEALRLMQGGRGRQVSVAPVIDDGLLVGLLRVHEIIKEGIR